MKNLQTKEGRILEIEKLENSFLKKLKDYGIEISEDAVCDICSESALLGISSDAERASIGYKMALGSHIQLYAAKEDSCFKPRKNQINFGTSGSFTPDEMPSYWRTIHAASILKNWRKVCETVNEYCRLFSELEKETMENLYHKK